MKQLPNNKSNDEDRERLILALTSAEAGIWNWDLVNNKIIWDDYLHYLFGVKKGEFSGEYSAAIALIHPDDREMTNKIIQNVLKSGSDYESEFRTIQPDGTLFNIAARGHIYRDADGKPIRMTGICWNITQRKHTEAELKKSKELAEKLAEKAEEASRTKSAFLASMSHEIRTPLNGIMGMLSLLYETMLTTEQRSYIESARKASDVLLSIINEILDFSKIESGKLELDKIDFKLQTLLDDTVQLIVTETQHKGIYIKTYIDPNIPDYLLGSASRLRQVLTNLMTNAVKFTDNGGITVNIKLKSKNSHIILLFEIIDTGIGFSSETKERLFKPFSQGDISTSRKYGGAGLGLVICKRLVEMMNGTIHVESTEGKGSKFWFTVSLDIGADPGLDQHKSLPTEMHNLRILCIDDNSINREIVKRQTESLHLRCDSISNATEAISILENAHSQGDPYKMIIVDHTISGMNGFELIKQIRTKPNLLTTKIIYMSSLNETINTDNMKQFDISVNIVKPLRQQKLYDAIVAVLRPGLHHIYGYTEIGSAHRANYRILVAEDNPINQMFILRVLSKLGYRADPVENGLEVLNAIAHTSYHLILMDCQMPIMDGYTTTREIRTLEASSKTHIPIIAMTAHAMKGDRDKCIATGMDDYLSKPINIKALDTTIQLWLSNQPNPPLRSLDNDIPRPSQHAGLIDMQRLHDVFGDNPEEIHNFLLMFAQSCNDLLKNIKAAIDHNDHDAIKSCFHRLKGSAANSGFTELANLCLETENQLDSIQRDKLYQAHHTAELLVEHLRDTLTKQ